MDYRVNNLAVDLRDGVRLARLVELLANDWTLTQVGLSARRHHAMTAALTPSPAALGGIMLRPAQDLRYPAVDRAQRLHNVKTVFKALVRYGVSLGEVRIHQLTPDDVVDGHRERTLNLIWKIILHWQVDSLLNEDLIQQEIATLKRQRAAMASDADEPLDSVCSAWMSVYSSFTPNVNSPIH